MLEWREIGHMFVLNIFFLGREVTQKSCSCCSWNALTALAEVCFVFTMEPILCWCKGHVEGFNLGQDLSLLLLSASIFIILLTLLVFFNCSKLAHAVNFTLNVHLYPLKRPLRCFFLKLLLWAYNNRAHFLWCVCSCFCGFFCFSKFSNELVHRVECCLHFPFDLVLNHFSRWICFFLSVFFAS